MDIVRNLGFYWCSDMKNIAHVNQLTSRVFPTICNMTKIQHILDKSMTKMLMQALVLSKVDYCNSLLLGSSQYNIRKLQRLQNMCARIIYRAWKYDCITPLLMELHWVENWGADWIQSGCACVQMCDKNCTDLLTRTCNIWTWMKTMLS